MKITPLSLFILSVSVCSPVIGNTNSVALDSVVTTGTRTAKTLQNSPVSVEYISEDELKAISSGTLTQVMEYIPGVVLTPSRKQGYNVSMMGFSGDKVLILLNGQRLISNTDEGVDLDQISANNIDHIEVIRGPASVLYGSAAMGGVINIITKQIEDNRTRFSYEVGSYGDNELNGEVNHFSLSQSLVAGNAKGRLSLQYIDDPGFDYDTSTEGADGTNREKLFVDAQLAYDLGDLAFSYHPQILKEDRKREEDDEVFPGDLGSVEEQYESEADRIIHDVSIANNKQAWKIQLRHAEHEESSGFITSPAREAEYQIQNIDAQKVWRFGRSEVATGLVWDKESLDSPEDEIDNRHAFNREGFAQLDFMFNENLEVLAGLRTQESDQFGSETTGRISSRLAGEFGPGRWTLRAGLAESYKVPTLKQQYHVFDHSIYGYVVWGNKDLKPESAVTKTLSFSYDFHAGHHFELNLHQSQVENLINEELDPNFSSNTNGPDNYVYQNIDKARIAGASIAWEQLITDRWRYGLNYTYTDKRESNGERIPYNPRNQVKANVNWQYYPKRLQVIFYLIHQSEIEVDETEYDEIENHSWLTANISLRQSLSNELSWRFAVDNIFDEHKDTALNDRTFDDRPQSSQKVSLGLTYEF